MWATAKRKGREWGSSDSSCCLSLNYSFPRPFDNQGQGGCSSFPIAFDLNLQSFWFLGVLPGIWPPAGLETSSADKSSWQGPYIANTAHHSLWRSTPEGDCLGESCSSRAAYKSDDDPKEAKSFRDSWDTGQGGVMSINQVRSQTEGCGTGAQVSWEYECTSISTRTALFSI